MSWGQGLAGLLVGGLLLAAGAGCGSDKDTAEELGTGQITFWTDYAQCGSVLFDFCVQIEEEEKCSSPQSGEPDCGDSGAGATFRLTEGNHGFHAGIDGGDPNDDWHGAASISDRVCSLYQLEC